MKLISRAALLTTVASVAAEPFNTKISVYPKSILLGEIIRIEAEAWNASGKPVHVANASPGFVFNIEIQRADGKPVNPRCIYPEDGDFVIQNDPTPIPISWKDNTHVECQIREEPGTWIVRSYVKSEGMQRGAHGKEIRGNPVWRGRVYSEPVEIEILKFHDDADREAYDYFKQNPLSPAHAAELLRRFPTSIYAGYAFKSLGSFVSVSFADSEGTVRELSDPGYYKSRPFRNPENPSEFLADPENAARERIKAIENFLALHPDFDEKHELYWQLAPLYLSVGRAQDAFDAWRKYQDVGKSDTSREFARRINGLLAQKNMAK